MSETLLLTLSLLPVGFWVVVILLVGGMIWAVGKVRGGLGVPVIVTLGTVAGWYVADVLYNDYLTYVLMFTPDVLENAWWQVALFLVAFLFLAPHVHQWMNGREFNRSSQVVRMFKTGVDQPRLQLGLQGLLKGCLIVWVVLSIFAAIRLKSEVLYYFCPYLSYRADPWSRDRIGTGIDSILSFASYLQLFVAVIFGITAALIMNLRFCALALLGMFATWPYFIFDRTRNTMLATVLPAIIAWVFLRLRVNIVLKIVLLAGFFLLINAWFGFVMSHRSDTGSLSIASAFAEEGFDAEQSSNVHHEGLNMFQELCWINTFIADGTYKPNWGQRYFDEIVNPIPRSLWPGKPLIGIDYAVLRGQSFGDDPSNAGVGATISTGMIGQGVVNFGEVLGPAFAAFLMSLWAAFLARLDLRGQGMGKLPLYGLGLILTFNLGRDITLITLYTFIFGYLLTWLLDRGTTVKASHAKTVQARSV